MSVNENKIFKCNLKLFSNQQPKKSRTKRSMFYVEFTLEVVMVRTKIDFDVANKRKWIWKIFVTYLKYLENKKIRNSKVPLFLFFLACYLFPLFFFLILVESLDFYVVVVVVVICSWRDDKFRICDYNQKEAENWKIL